MSSLPIMIMNQNTHREQGKKVQVKNIQAAKAVADVIRTCLGPRAMLKMLMSPTGGIVMTNDGNAILREISVEQPAAKSVIELSRTQDEEVGDGTTSVIILTGELLAQAAPLLEQKIHPTKIISAFREAKEDCLEYMKNTCSIKINSSNRDELLKVVKSCLGTKFMNKWSDMACKIALDAVAIVTVEEGGRKEIDIKRYAKIEKIPGGAIEDSEVLRGVMINKDIIHPNMRRRIEKPRILLLDMGIEYKKGESQTAIEITKESDMMRALQLEEEYVKRICEDIIRCKPDLIITEKGVSDLAQHYFMKANISVIRRLRKTDNLRVARCCGANIVSNFDDLKEEDIGNKAGLFEIKLIGDEYFTFITECQDPKACTILLRGTSKDVLAEVERNLNDAMCVARNVLLENTLVPGGGAFEMALAANLNQIAQTTIGVKQTVYNSFAQALEVIPRTLAQNCGSKVLKLITELRAKHASDLANNWSLGVDGEEGVIADMKKLGIWDPMPVKAQVLKTAVEASIMILRIDDILSGTKKQKMGGGEVAE